MDDDVKKFLDSLKILMSEKGWNRNQIKDMTRGEMSPYTVDALFNHKRMGEKKRNLLARSLHGCGFHSAADLINYRRSTMNETEIWKHIAKLESDINKLKDELREHSHPHNNIKGVINGGK